jgi:hypothetical protein
MSNATTRNFGAGQRERDRRVARALEGEMPIGSLAVTGDPAWDAFYGSLHDKAAEANAAGMGFRADLGSIGRPPKFSGGVSEWSDPPQAGDAGGLTQRERASIGANLGLAQLTDRRRLQAEAEQRANIEDMQGAYQQHVLDSVAQPAIEEPVTLGSTGANGEPKYTMRNMPSAHPLSRRQQLLARTPGSMLPQVDAALAPQERADAATALDVRQQAEAERHAKEAERIADKAAGTRKPLTQTSEAALINKLAGDWTKANSTNNEMDRQFQIMKSGLNRYDQDPNGASQAVLITFQKMLDPDSVVRESEYDRSAQGLSLKSRIQGYMENLAVGGAKVPKADLEKMVATAEEFKKNTQDAPTRARKRIESTADRYEIPHEMIFGGSAHGGGGSAGGGGGGESDPRFSAPVEGAQKGIPGIPGGLAKFTNGKWIRVQ